MTSEISGCRVLVCGGRDYDDATWLTQVLDEGHAKLKFTALIEGGAKGADAWAALWARGRGVPVVTFKADWGAHGRAAGPLRNEKMLNEGRPDLVVAFPGGRGTADMVARAKRAGVRVVEATRTDPAR